MKKTLVILALLVTIVSLGAVLADDTADVDVAAAAVADDNNTTNVTNDTNDTTDVPGAAGSDDVADLTDNATTDDTNDTNTTPAAGEPVKETPKPVENKMLETGLPVVALVLVVLAAVGLYRRD